MNRTLDLDGLPAGPLQDLLSEVGDLRVRAGNLGTRRIAKAVDVSHTTIAKFFKSTELPDWPRLRKIVACLAGEAGIKEPESEVARFEQLWRHAKSGGERSYAAESGGFNIGPIRSPYIIVEGDGEMAISREDIRLIITPSSLMFQMK